MSRASFAENDSWVRDGEKLLLWIPWQYQYEVKVEIRLVIGEEGARIVGVVRGRLSTGVQVQRDTMGGNLRGRWKREGKMRHSPLM